MIKRWIYSYKIEEMQDKSKHSFFVPWKSKESQNTTYPIQSNKWNQILKKHSRLKKFLNLHTVF